MGFEASPDHQEFFQVPPGTQSISSTLQGRRTVFSTFLRRRRLAVTLLIAMLLMGGSLGTCFFFMTRSPDLPNDIPLIARANLVSYAGYRDNQHQSWGYLVSNTPLSQALAFYQQALPSRGWQAQTPGPEAPKTSFFWSKNDDCLIITFFDHKEPGVSPDPPSGGLKMDIDLLHGFGSRCF